MPTLLTVSNLLSQVSEFDSVVDISNEYIRIDSVPRLGHEICELLATFGYWETHDFGMFNEVSDSFKHHKNDFIFNHISNNTDYCSNLLAFYEQREKHSFRSIETSTSLFLKVVDETIVGVGLLKKVPSTVKNIFINQNVYTQTKFIGYAEFYIPTALRKLGYGF